MKSATVPLTVILLAAATLFIAKATTHGSEIILPQGSLKKETATSLPQQPGPKKADALKAASVKLTEPKINTIKREKYTISCDTISCGGVMPPLLTEEDDSDKLISCDLETEAEYPGGAAAWHRFLNKNLKFPIDSIGNGISGTVMVQFIVNEDGNVTDVKAISGSEPLSTEAVRVIKQSSKWTPGRKVSNGRCIKSIKRQPFVFRGTE